jgi:very-short-patch-repair endonuclease/predicted transcriptional regulator of viral defense system
VPIVEGERRALAVASDQYGVITRAQARAAGLSEDRIKHRLISGRWERVHPEVYRIVGAPAVARQRALAACLWLGDEAAVSHMTAARLLKLDGMAKQVPLHLSMPLERRHSSLRPRSFILHRVRRFDAVDRVVVDGIPCTSATRTLLDVAALVGEETLEVAFESARRLGLASVGHLTNRYLEVGGRGRTGSAKIRRLLERQRVEDRPLESALEVKLWRLLQRGGVPLPDRQVVLAFGTLRRYRVDFLWREARLVLECDGFEAHAGHLRWKRDRRRVADIELLGYRLLQVTWDDVVRRPKDTVERVRLALLHQRLSTGGRALPDS